MTHTIGSHSDDRGGESDNPCYCDVITPQPDELYKILLDVSWSVGGPSGTEDIEKAHKAIEAYVAQKCIDELKNIPRTHSKMAYIEQRIKVLTNNRGGEDE